MTIDIAWGAIDLLAMDCDGVLTDGGITLDGNGTESRRFYVHDGDGMRAMMGIGVHIAILSGAGNAQSTLTRGRQLKIAETHIGVADKAAKIAEVAARLGVDRIRTAFIGDDRIDLGAMAWVGIPIAVPNAIAPVREAAIYVTERHGGDGAVREVCDLIQMARTGSVLR